MAARFRPLDLGDGVVRRGLDHGSRLHVHAGRADGFFVAISRINVMVSGATRRSRFPPKPFLAFGSMRPTLPTSASVQVDGLIKEGTHERYDTKEERDRRSTFRTP